MESSRRIMNQIKLFSGNIQNLSYMKLGKVSAEDGVLKIESGQDKNVCKWNFDDLFQIRGKIERHLAEIQSAGAAEQVKGELQVFKDKLVAKIKENRGWFGSMSKEEKQLLDVYFNQMNALIDTPAPGIVRQLLGGALRLGVTAAVAYGVYRYFSQ